MEPERTRSLPGRGSVAAARPHQPGGRVNHIRTSAAIAVASGVAVASLALPSAASAKPPTTRDPAAAAAGYLTRQLGGKHHDHLVGSFTSGGKTHKFADYGETADAILSID